MAHLKACTALNAVLCLAVLSRATRAAGCDVTQDIARDTAEAYQQLLDNQHPADCSRASYLLCQHSRGGVGNFGSKLVALASCLGRALQLHAVAIQATGHMGLGSISDQLAPFQAWSNCTLQDALAAKAADPRRVTVADFVHFPQAHEDSVHGVRQMSFESAPRRWRRRGPVWWKAVELRFVLRPTPQTTGALAEAKAALEWGGSSGGAPVHAMHVRRGDKIGTESHYYPFMYFAEALALMTDRSDSHAADDQALALYIATDAPGQVSMETEPYANLKAGFLPEDVLLRHSGPAKKKDLAVALDMLLLAEGRTLALTGSSNFGVAALYLNLLNRDFCLNFTTLDVWHPFWWGDDTLHHGRAMELYQHAPEPWSHSPGERFIYSSVRLWSGRSDRFVGMGRGSYKPTIDVAYDMSVYYSTQYARDIQAFLCYC